MDNETLQLLIDATFPADGEAPGAKAVERLIRQFPYFTLPAARLLHDRRGELPAESVECLTRSVALSSPDQASLYMLLEREADEHIGFYPEGHQTEVTTESAIDTFLNTYGSTSPEEEEMLNRLIFNPTPDYAQLLAREEESNLPTEGEAEAGSPDDLLNTFIIKQKQSAGVISDPTPPPPTSPADRRSEEPPQATTDNSLLSESLAKIFIKQRHYQRAYEIISQLSLNYPEKSVYFADQLRFLRKLINYQNHKEQSSK